jgi:hypothetical protein
MRLSPVNAEVLSPQSFSVRYNALLTAHECAFLNRAQNCLHGDAGIAECVRVPRLATHDDGADCSGTIIAKPCGARSALWELEHIQFKGCRPDQNHAEFPAESLPFGEDKIARGTIPYGVMTAEAVMRELLGYCFCRVHGIPCASEPVCIYRYEEEPAREGFCLVLRIVDGRRVEEFQRTDSVPISALVDATESTVSLLGTETPLQGLNVLWYSHQKSRWLAELHFHGGFRGLLNNNIGNDVVSVGPDGTRRFFFCDFDTFKLISLPATTDKAFLDAFALQTVVEVVKGSLPILEHVKAPLTASLAETARQVAAVYRQKSSLWNAYRERARLKVKECGWDWPDFEQACLHAFESPAFLEASCSVILSEYALERYGTGILQDYTPH